MAKRLCYTSREELKEEMSIAGSPDKVMKAMNEMYEVYTNYVDATNGAELLNFDLAIRRILAENKLAIRHLEKRINQKIL